MKSKKILIGIAAVALLSLMIANVYAQLPSVPTQPCSCGCTGLTPGFWKHNIKVRLDGDSIGYSALPDGTKLTNDLMDEYLTAITTYLYGPHPTFTFEQALVYLKLPGWSTDRTNTANWFNWAAGYGPF